jgi:tetratricopeptide (TPR) repeat protein
MNLRVGLLISAMVILLFSPVLAADPIASDDSNATDNAWYWYNVAVDLANAGKFSEALTANEKALARNDEFELAWANQAGILVQLGRYDDAVKAADRVLLSNRSGLPMPNTFAAAYYSKGDALLALGNVSGAKDSYAKAYNLDPTLIPPDISSGTVAAVPVSARATKSPLSPVIAIGAVLAGLACSRYLRPS